MSGLYLLRAGGVVAGSLATSYLYYTTFVQRMRDDHLANMKRIETCEAKLFKAADACDKAVQQAFGLQSTMVAVGPPAGSSGCI